MTKELKSKVFIPQNYKSKLSLIETEIAIKKVKDFFESNLAATLNLTRVSAPLFLENGSGLNDNLNGIERPVSFDMLAIKDSNLEIVHSLAKWKRFALHRYKFQPGSGLYTDMNAIRRDEELDNLHSIYVDQWDWEKVITKEERKNLVYLLKNLKAKIKGLRPIEEAIVTAGGVNTLEIDPSTMKSKIISNLSFAGEVIDVDAFTGGYNVQIALSTGYIAGSSI